MSIFDSKKSLNNKIDGMGKLIKTQGSVIKELSLKRQDFLKLFGIDGDRQKLNNAYKQIPIVYSCIRSKAKNFAQVPFRIYKGEAEITSGQMYDLIQDVNPTIDSFQFFEGISTGLDCTGNSYIILDENEVNGIPVALWLFSPDWVSPAYDRSGVWIGYWLDKPDGKAKEFIPPERVIHNKYFNPSNPLVGLSPMGILQQTNQTLWAAAEYNKLFFENDATPPYVYKSDKTPSARVIEELRESLINKRKGLRKAHEPQILYGGMEVQTVGLSQKDIEFIELMKFNREDIIMVYGVTKKVVGLYEDMNNATAISAEIQFWEDTIMPMAKMVEMSLNKKLLLPHGYTGKFDFSSIDVLNHRVTDKTDVVVKLLSTGQFTRNELNQRFRLGFEQVSWGDEPPMQIAPITASAKAVAPKIETQRADKKEINVDNALLATKWAKDITPLMPVMSGCAKAVRRYFYDVQQTIMNSITKKVDGVRYVKAISDNIPEQEIKEAFSDEDLYKAMEPFLIDAIKRGWESISEEAFQMDNADALAVLGERRIKVIEMNQNAQTEIIEKLRSVIAEGLADGISNDDMSVNIIDALTGKMKNIQRRAATIARTEVNGSFSESRWNRVQEDPPKLVRWISSRDPNVRDSHQHLDGKAVPYGQKFSNGMKFPHDPNGSAGEVINCRCTWEPVYSGDE